LTIEGSGTRRVPDEWYVGFHHGLAARFWRAAGATMAEADFKVVLGLLPAAPATVLDVPCGDGRLTRPLAQAGYDATGIDISRSEIEHARQLAGATVRFEPGDLRALPDGVGRFDAIVSWGNSFGYLTPAQTLEALSGFRRRLNAQGRLILESQTVAESFLIGGIKAHSEYEFGGIAMTATNRYRPEESRYESDYRFEDEHGEVERSCGAHHVHTTGEVVRLLHAAGFENVELRGPDGQTPYELGDRRMIAVAS
jgi:SAM-dependent methyltransferase